MDDSPEIYRCSLLIVDAEPDTLAKLREFLAADFDVMTADSAESARQVLMERSVDIVLTDQQLPGQTGVQLLETVCLYSPQTIRILMAGAGRLEDAVDAINCGRVHRYLFKPWNSGQLLHTLRLASRQYQLERSNEKLLDELREFNRQLENKIKERTIEFEQANRQLQQRNLMLTRMALTDPLTGLPNRRAMDRLAKNELARRARYPSPMAIAILDVDHFKDINSVHLLSGGDHALTWLAATLSTTIRAVDTVGRIGGEEFMLVAPETDPEGAWILIERIRTAIADGKTVFGGAEIRMTVSIGIAVAHASMPGGYETLRHAAAEALGDAKSAGRNRTVMKLLDSPVAK